MALINELGIGKISNEMLSNTSVDTKGKTITFPIDYIEKLLGIEIPEMDIVRILGNLGIIATIKGKKLSCITPPIRTDIDGPNDIIEEIIRYYGYDKLKSTRMEKTTPLNGGLSKTQALRTKVADAMLLTGAHQTISYSFVSPKQLDNLLLPKNSLLRNVMEIKNPLSLDYSIMRTTLVGSLLEIVATNNSRRNQEIALFEVSSTYEKPQNEDELPKENNVLCFVDTNAKSDFYSTKSIVEMLGQVLGVSFSYKPTNISFLHPNISASIVLGNKVVGFIGKIHPRAARNFEIDSDVYCFELNLDLMPEKKTKKVKPLPKFPASVRDMAVVVDEMSKTGEMLSLIQKTAGQLCESVELFDVYRGAPLKVGQKSVAWKLTFRKPDATITQQEVNECFDKILSALKEKFNAVLR